MRLKIPRLLDNSLFASRTRSRCQCHHALLNLRKRRMARLQPQRPHAITSTLERPQLQLQIYVGDQILCKTRSPHTARSLHAVMEDLPDEVVTMIAAHLPARDVKWFALACRLFAAWAELLDVVNADTVGDCSGLLRVHCSRLSDLFQRRTIRSLVLAQSQQSQWLLEHGIQLDDTAWRLFCHRPALQHLQLLALEYLMSTHDTRRLVLGVANVLSAGGLPQLRSLTLAGIVPSDNVPRLLDGAARCPLLSYLDLKDLEPPSARAAPDAAPHEHAPFA